jgi:hypothetical protein
MENLHEYHDKLIGALESKAENLELTVVPKLREHLQGFEAGVSAIYKFLINKGLMQSDPYKNERSVTEIQIPSAEPLSDADITQELSQRFSQYVSQWEFIVNIFHVSLSNLNLKKIRLLLDLIDYIRWTDFSVNSSYQITRALAGIVGRVSRMNDPMAGKIMSSSATHLRELTNKIKSDLKSITVFLKEHYKLQVRQKITGRMKIDPEQYRRKPGTVLDNVKFEFSHTMKESGWYKELIYELLEEDYGTAAEKLREAALENLKVVRMAAVKKKRTGPDDKIVLMGVLEKMARAGDPIQSCLVKMNDNSRTIQERKKSLGERLSEIFSSLFKRNDNAVEYEIGIKDAVTGAVRLELLNYSRFASVTMKRARALRELQDSNSSARNSAKAASAEQLLMYLNKNLNELKTIHRWLSGLDDYFLSKAVPSEIRDSMKGSGFNLKNLKAVIGETMRMLTEYRVRKEEEEQLKKLGIED